MAKLSLLVALIFLTSCGFTSSPPPDLDNACDIIRERPGWKRSMKHAERRWGIPMQIQMATIYQESKFEARARTPMRWFLGIIPLGRQSSAYGYAQVIDGTWDWYRRSTHSPLARRDRFSDATDFIGWYMNKSHKKDRIAKTDARNQYLAYHEGQTGYARGTYRNKAWLLRVADKVAQRAAMYEVQLRRCR